MYEGVIGAVHWEPTDKCNSRCPMCPRYNKGEEIPTLENEEWTFDNFVKAWHPGFLTHLQKLLSCGNFGDPCACKDFSKIYQYVRSVNPNIMLCCNTNGSLRNPDWWYNLGTVMRAEQSRGNYCTFSLDGLEDTNHLYRRGTVWSKIMENVKAYIDGGGVAHWDYIVFEHNEHQVEEARDLAIKMGFKNFNIKRTTRWQSYNDQGQGEYPVYNKGEVIYLLKAPKQEKFIPNFGDADLFKQKEAVKRQSLTLDDFKNMKMDPNYTARYVNGEYHVIHLNKLSVACRAQKNVKEHTPWNEIFISAGGHVAPCCFLGSEPFLDRTKHVDTNYLKLIELNGGLDTINMHKHDILDILQTPIFKNYIPWSWTENKDMMPKKCGECCGVEWNALDFGELGNKKDGYIK